MSEEEEAPCLVIDIGTSLFKAGFAGDDVARFVFPSLVIRSKAQQIFITQNNDTYVGEDAFNKINGRYSGYFRRCYPTICGEISNFDDFEKILHSTFYNELRACPDKVLLCENPFCNDREKLAEMMFEKFDTKELSIQHRSFLSLLATGRTSGCVLFSGNNITYSSCYYDSKFCGNKCIFRENYGGLTITKEIGNQLYNTLYITKDEAFEEVKKGVCVIPSPENNEINDCNFTTQYSQDLLIPSSLRKLPELFFLKANISKYGQMTIDELVLESIYKIRNKKIEKEICENIVLSGGNTMVEGFSKRLESKLKKSCNFNVKVIASPERQQLAWIGGSIFGSLAENQKSFLSKEIYDEFGSSIINRQPYNIESLHLNNITKEMKGFEDIDVNFNIY